MATPIWIGGNAGNETTYTTAANWSTASAPTTNDDPVVPARILYNIAGSDQSATVLSSFTVEDGSTATLGSISTQGIATRLQLNVGGAGGKTFYFGGTGRSFLYVKNAVALEIAAAATGSAALLGMDLTGVDNTATIIRAAAGQAVGLCWLTGGIYETDTLTIGGGSVYLGDGMVMKDGSTPVPVVIQGGTVYSRPSLGAVVMTNGTLNIESGTITSLDVTNSTANLTKACTITTGTIRYGGKIDLSLGSGSVVFTNTIQMSAGAQFLDPYGRAGNVVIKLNNCRIQDVTIQSAAEKTITYS